MPILGKVIGPDVVLVLLRPQRFLVLSARSFRRPLLTGGILNKRRQSLHVHNQKLPVSLLKDSDLGKAAEFAGNSLAVSTGAARKISMRWRWYYFSCLALMP